MMRSIVAGLRALVYEVSLVCEAMRWTRGTGVRSKCVDSLIDLGEPNMRTELKADD